MKYIDWSIFAEIITYYYLGKIDLCTDNTVDLYAAADYLDYSYIMKSYLCDLVLMMSLVCSSS